MAGDKNSEQTDGGLGLGDEDRLPFAVTYRDVRRQ